VDTEPLAAGFLGVTPPWKSDELARKLGLDLETFERHTALGDARLARAMFNAVYETRR
jgi:DNA polymerase III epsilon subunit-like protein